ncbi:phage integrase SAM-like domain-containing protein [Sulfurospirillum sp. 'SP']|nr:tyrosine-type recombinase/integrase [Sulfurospirillum sp. 'SP']WNY99486.1 phage integrase SAM-like domain-containing protein [Sulfurospirillum sp. 'SP']
MAVTKPLKIGLPIHYHNLDYVNFIKKDIKQSANTSLRLYRVENMYYYRRTINKKTYRISLKTQDLQKAKKLKNEFNLLKNEEFVKMAKEKDYKKVIKAELNTNIEFDGETMEKIMELGIRALGKNSVYADILKEKQLTEQTIYKISDKNDLDEISKKLDNITSSHIHPKHPQKEQFTFQQLEDLFLLHKEKVGKVGVSSIKMYKAAFKDLIKYFQDTDINELKYNDFENFQNFLISKKLNNKTINNKITYLRMFMDHAEKFEFIEKNLANKLEMLKEEVKIKENFTNEEVNLLLENSPKEFKDFLKVAMYTGMRLQEILAIDKVLIDEKTQIKYIQVGDSKTTSGIRKVPLHQELLNIKFPLFIIKSDVRTFSTNVGKKINRYIKSSISKDKTIHTYRANFVNQIVNNFPDKIEVCQEIIGHSKGNKSITVNIYAKEFDLKLKKEIVDSVKYNQN